MNRPLKRYSWRLSLWALAGLCLLTGSWSQVQAAGPGAAGGAGGAESGREAGQEGGGRGGKPLRESRREVELDQDQIATVLEILRQHRPELAQRLEEALEKHPDRAQRILADQWPRLTRLIELKQRDPRTFEITLSEMRLMGQARELFIQWRVAMKNGDQDQADQIKQQLTQVAGQLFDLNQEFRLREVERLEQRAQELRQQIQTRAVERDALIQQRLEELFKRPGSIAGSLFSSFPPSPPPPSPLPSGPPPGGDHAPPPPPGGE